MKSEIQYERDKIVHLGHMVRVNPEMIERRANDLYTTGRRVLQNSEDALVILGEFNERWRKEYSRYLKEHAKTA